LAGRRQQAAFRPASTPVTTSAPSRRQAIALVTVLLLVAAAIAVASFAVKPSKARSFHLFYGSVFIDDDTAPVSIDLASGKPTVRLPDAYQQVAAKQPGDVDVVPLAGATLLLDTVTGEFNMVDSTGIVAKSGGGVSVGKASETTTSLGLASGDSAYIVRTGASSTSVYLVTLATVTSAIGGGPVRPRASAGMDDPVKDGATSTVTANNDLWMLAGAGSSRTIRQLGVPKGSNPGATLTTADHGTVNAVTALGVSTAKRDGSGGDVVAAASSDSIQIFDATGGSHSVGVKASSDVDSILPITNEEGAFAFLYHSSSGWSVVRAAVDGSRDAVVQPLTGIDGAAPLAVPAQSNGSLYTADLSSGALWQIGTSGAAAAVPDVSKYPLIAGETADFSQIKIAARGARVILNSRAKLEAVTVFTDSSQKPVINDKRTAVELTANGAAAALNDLHHKPTHPSKAPPKTRVDPAQQVTDKINCATVKQTPHIPTVDLVGRASRSVQLHWTYPLLDRQDCAPSTYTVTVKLLSDNAPSAPHLPPIQGSTGVNVTGLFPDTQYSIVVTAYINGKGTSSAPLPVRTTVEGPAAPTGVHATVDDQGNWIVGWNSCGGVQNSCVPAANWTVIPQLCDGAGGLVNAPANLAVVGDPTSHTFTAKYKGNPSLLGRGLNFQVEGVGLKGTAGTASARSACAFSWAHPIAGNIHVAASTPPAVSGQADSHTTVTVSFTGDKDVDLGGVGGQLTYQLLSGGVPVGNAVGPTSDTSVSLSGILPGQAYTVRVTVSPPRHPTASVSLPPVAVEAAVANWPTLTATASFKEVGSSDGTLTVAIGGLKSSDARGETFDLVNSQLRCGNSTMSLNASNFDPAKPLTFADPDEIVHRQDNNGSCQATIQLAENSSTKRSPTYFGGNPSHSASGSVNIPVPTLDTSAGQFAANFVSSGILSAPSTAVSYQGNNSLLHSYADGWSTKAQYKDDTGNWIDCGGGASSDGNLAAAPVTLDLSSCYYSNRGAAFQVVVDFTYFGQSPSPAYAIAVDGSGPQPVDGAQLKDCFEAGWGYFGDHITVSYKGADCGNPYPESTLEQLDWTETVTSGGTTCVVSHDPPTNQIPTGDDFFAACPPTTGGSSSGATGTPEPPTPSTYTIAIHFVDPNYKNTGDYTVTVDGTP
jgi:hypothetical protein